MCVKGLFSLPDAQITRGGDKPETDAREATTENPGRISTAWRTLQVSPPVNQTLLRRARKDGEQRDILEIRSCAVFGIKTRATSLSQQCWQGVVQSSPVRTMRFLEPAHKQCFTGGTVTKFDPHTSGVLT